MIKLWDEQMAHCDIRNFRQSLVLIRWYLAILLCWVVLVLRGNGTTLCCSSQYASAPMALALWCVAKFKSVQHFNPTKCISGILYICCILDKYLGCMLTLLSVSLVSYICCSTRRRRGQAQNDSQNIMEPGT